MYATTKRNDTLACFTADKCLLLEVTTRRHGQPVQTIGAIDRCNCKRRNRAFGYLRRAEREVSEHQGLMTKDCLDPPWPTFDKKTLGDGFIFGWQRRH